MNEVEVAEYCRKKGLYKEQIDSWHAVCLNANGRDINQTKQLTLELKDERKRAYWDGSRCLIR
ncbi:hypothetical protein ACOI1C_18460 [Bacillus sp. DJP31]|uniref:hypothetical protein n=1 Tax=Bacillus sp. DJP31 TaxID=3409789 RepID=UPI003BB770DE